MNKRQKIMIVVAAVLVVAMCLIPPWTGHYPGRGFSALGYRPIWSPPVGHNHRDEFKDFWGTGKVGNEGMGWVCYRVDVPRLIVQIFAVAVAAGTAVWLLKTPSRPKRDEDE